MPGTKEETKIPDTAENGNHQIQFVDMGDDAFAVHANGPCTVEVIINWERGHAVAHIYSQTNPDEYDEPVGGYDNSLKPHERNDWTYDSQNGTVRPAFSDEYLNKLDRVDELMNAYLDNGPMTEEDFYALLIGHDMARNIGDAQTIIARAKKYRNRRFML